MGTRVCGECFEFGCVCPRPAKDARATKWMPLRDLRAGAVFRAKTGWSGVRTAELQAADTFTCIDLADGMRSAVSGDELVSELPLL